MFCASLLCVMNGDVVKFRDDRGQDAGRGDLEKFEKTAGQVPSATRQQQKPRPGFDALNPCQIVNAL